MTDFELIPAFIKAGLADKVLHEWKGDNGKRMKIRLLPPRNKELVYWHWSESAHWLWEWLGSRMVENELLRQMTEYCDERGVDVSLIEARFEVFKELPDGRADSLTVSGKWHWALGLKETEREDEAVFPTRPEALLAACVAIKEETADG